MQKEIKGTIGGQRRRPRAAIIGNFERSDLSYLHRIFPTLWVEDTYEKLCKDVDVREIDVLIIGPNIEKVSNWADTTHVICFSDCIYSLPGPCKGSYIYSNDKAQTEEYFLPEVSPQLYHLRETAYTNSRSIRGLPIIKLEFDNPRPYIGPHSTPILSSNYATQKERNEAKEMFFKGSLIIEDKTKLPLAIFYQRTNNNLGVAWLPSVKNDFVYWVDLIVTQWAKSDNIRLPNFGDWQRDAKWLIPEESKLLTKIQSLERQKEQYLNNLTNKLNIHNRKLEMARLQANKGRRRLLTAQKDELVEEVEIALSQIGFNVVNMDKSLGDSKNKIEDLRLYDPHDNNWDAIVEVRGHTRSGGSTEDLQRMHKFAELYFKETGNWPAKRIYIVNGQIELPPTLRQRAFDSAPGDVNIFADLNGIIIWSVDLFLEINKASKADYHKIRESIKQARGRWP